jgi:hypothetical protein
MYTEVPGKTKLQPDIVKEEILPSEVSQFVNGNDMAPKVTTAFRLLQILVLSNALCNSVLHYFNEVLQKE